MNVNILRLFYFIPTWVLFLLFRTIMILLGWLFVPIAALSNAHEIRESKIYKKRLVRAFKWKWIWSWGNEEEGIGWYTLKDSWPVWARIIYSECFRNPANNLRYVPFISLKIDSSKVRWIGSLGNYEDKLSKDQTKKYDSDKELFWSLTWQGWYSNIRVHFKFFGMRFRFWLGWKIYPEDKFGLPSYSHRNASAGFATQFKRID